MIQKLNASIKKLALCATLGVLSVPAAAQAASEWEMNLQTAASPSAAHIHDFHNMMLWIISGIVLFVFALLVWVIVRYNDKANPTPAKFTHNVLIEVIWTVVPVIILIVIAIPSYKMLYYTDRIENPEMTLKVTGRQWYWDYEYPDNDGITFSSYMIPDAEIKKDQGQSRLLSTDTKVVLPIDTNIQIIVTGGDVIHAWAVPALGVKIDAVPGRLNETWTRIEKPGVYYGQCSELCGKDHAYMPIEIHAVTKEEFQQWLVKAKEEFAGLPNNATAQFAYLEE